MTAWKQNLKIKFINQICYLITEKNWEKIVGYFKDICMQFIVSLL
jgi:hypothetical protein